MAEQHKTTKAAIPFSGAPGPKVRMGNSASVLDYYKLLIHQVIVDLINLET